MSDVTSGDTPSLGAVDDLVDLTNELIEAIREGAVPDRHELQNRFTISSERLDQMIKTAQMVVELRASGIGGLSIPQSTTTDSSAVPRQLGDFEILREIGKGGMGVVYEAKQISLQRRVALKILPFASVLDSRQLQRFKNESIAAAQLHHPHIVDVFGVGCERGIHYYAMRLIEGRSLAELISQLQAPAHLPQASIDPSAGTRHATSAELATPNIAHTISSGIRETATLASFSTDLARGGEFARSAALLGADVADALHHAHECGVVHRDIKPSNLLVDNEGRIWVADFGLAHLEAGAELTLSGELMGTLRYMSPEQVTGQRVGIDHRTDVYSLGVTLYELLSQQCPFEAESRPKLLRKILFEEPRSLRTAVRHVPNDLDTIVLKALSKSPGDRYSTAADLAADLRRFAHGQPIVARKSRWTERAWRWALRNPWHAGLSAALFLSLLVGTTASTIMAFHAIDSRNLADRRLSDVSEARRREQEALRRITESAKLEKDLRLKVQSEAQLAEQIVEKFYTDFAEKWVRQQVGMTDTQREFLQSAVLYYEQRQADQAPDSASRTQSARTSLRLALLHENLGQHKDADKSYRKALDVLPAESKDVSAIQALAEIHTSYGFMLWVVGQFGDAETHLREAIRLCTSTSERSGPEWDGLMHLCRARNHLALVLNSMRRVPEALAEFEAARQTRERLMANSPDNLIYKVDLAISLADIANLPTTPLTDAEELFKKAFELQSEACVKAPTDPEFRLLKSRYRFWLAALYERHALATKAAEAIPSAMQGYQTLSADFPDLLPPQSELASCHLLNSFILRQLGDFDRALKELLAAESLLSSIVEDSKARHADRLAHFQTNFEIGQLHRFAGLHDDARSKYEWVTEHSRQLLAESSTEQAARCRQWTGIAYGGLGLIDKAEGHRSEAIRRFQSSVELLDPLLSVFPEDHGLRGVASAMHGNLAGCLSDDNRPAEALAEFERMSMLLEPLRQKAPSQPMFFTDGAAGLSRYADFLQRQSKLAEAQKMRLDALRFAAESDRRSIKPDRGAHELIRSQVRTLIAAKDLARSEELLQLAISEFVDPDMRLTIAGQYYRLADAARQQDEFGDLSRSSEKRASNLAKQIVAVPPTDPELLNTLAWEFATHADTRLRNDEAAVSWAEAATRARPEYGDAWNTLGIALLRNGRFADAVEALRKSCELQGGGNAFDWYALAICEWRLQNAVKARAWLQKAKEWQEANQVDDLVLEQLRGDAETLIQTAPP